MLERCTATCGKAAGTRANMRPRARKEASAQQVRGYHKQFAEAKHLKYKSWVDNEVFDLVDVRKGRPKIYVTGRWVPTIKTDKQSNFLRAKARLVKRGFRTSRRSACRLIPLLPQDPDFGLAVRWQPAKEGIFFILISKRLSFKDNPGM